MIKTTLALIVGLIVVSIVVALPVGYVMNIVKFVQLDFKQPIRAEVVRGIGLVTGPVGSILGFVNIED